MGKLFKILELILHLTQEGFKKAEELGLMAAKKEPETVDTTAEEVKE